jgi:hypothetical protein
MDLDNGGSPADWFMMAAIDQHLGNDNDARRWYNRAVSWLKQSPAVYSSGASVRRSREEAIKALAIPVSTIDQVSHPVIEAMNAPTPHNEHIPDLSTDGSNNPRWP